LDIENPVTVNGVVIGLSDDVEEDVALIGVGDVVTGLPDNVAFLCGI